MFSRGKSLKKERGEKILNKKKGRMFSRFVILFFFGTVLVCNGTILLQLGENLSGTVSNSVQQLLGKKTNFTVIAPNQQLNLTSLGSQVVLLSFGNTSTSSFLIGRETLAKVGYEGFAIKSMRSKNGGIVLATNGNRQEKPLFSTGTSIGAHYGTYALLEALVKLIFLPLKLSTIFIRNTFLSLPNFKPIFSQKKKKGYGFFHPLEVIFPEKLEFGLIDQEETPYWSVRGDHYHTEHPL